MTVCFLVILLFLMFGMDPVGLWMNFKLSVGRWRTVTWRGRSERRMADVMIVIVFAREIRGSPSWRQRWRCMGRRETLWGNLSTHEQRSARKYSGVERSDRLWAGTGVCNPIPICADVWMPLREVGREHGQWRKDPGWNYLPGYLL